METNDWDLEAALQEAQEDQEWEEQINQDHFWNLAEEAQRRQQHLQEEDDGTYINEENLGSRLQDADKDCNCCSLLYAIFCWPLMKVYVEGMGKTANHNHMPPWHEPLFLVRSDYT